MIPPKWVCLFLFSRHCKNYSYFKLLYQLTLTSIAWNLFPPKGLSFWKPDSAYSPCLIQLFADTDMFQFLKHRLMSHAYNRKASFCLNKLLYVEHSGFFFKMYLCIYHLVIASREISRFLRILLFVCTESGILDCHISQNRRLCDSFLGYLSTKYKTAFLLMIKQCKPITHDWDSESPKISLWGDSA